MIVPVPGEKSTTETPSMIPLSAATNSMTDGDEPPNNGGGVVDKGKGSKKWKTLEEENAHLVLPDGSRRARKSRRRD